VFNTLLRFNKFGRMALSREDKIASNWVCAALVPAIVCGIYFAFTNNVVALVAGITLAFTTIFTSATFGCSRGWPRRTMTGLTVAFLLWGALVAGLLVAADHAEAANVDRYADMAASLFNVQIIAALVLQFTANALAQARPKR
jgi:ABC-type Na+ efflux pump permease subunit